MSAVDQNRSRRKRLELAPKSSHLSSLVVLGLVLIVRVARAWFAEVRVD